MPPKKIARSGAMADSVFTSPSEVQRTLAKLSSSQGFSSKWHSEFNAIIARVPFPPRTLGVAGDATTLAAHSPAPISPTPISPTPVDPTSVLLKRKPGRPKKVADPEPTANLAVPDAVPSVARSTESTECVDCHTELPPPPKRLRCHACLVKSTEGEVEGKKWLHDGSTPAVYRTRDEYLARFAVLERELEAMKKQDLVRENHKLQAKIADLEKRNAALVKGTKPGVVGPANDMPANDMEEVVNIDRRKGPRKKSVVTASPEAEEAKVDRRRGPRKKPAATVPPETPMEEEVKVDRRKGPKKKAEVAPSPEAEEAKIDRRRGPRKKTAAMAPPESPMEEIKIDRRRGPRKTPTVAASPEAEVAKIDRRKGPRKKSVVATDRAAEEPKVDRRKGPRKTLAVAANLAAEEPKVDRRKGPRKRSAAEALPESPAKEAKVDRRKGPRKGRTVAASPGSAVVVETKIDRRKGPRKKSAVTASPGPAVVVETKIDRRKGPRKKSAVTVSPGPATAEEPKIDRRRGPRKKLAGALAAKEDKVDRRKGPRKKTTVTASLANKVATRKALGFKPKPKGRRKSVEKKSTSVPRTTDSGSAAKFSQRRSTTRNRKPSLHLVEAWAYSLDDESDE